MSIVSLAGQLVVVQRPMRRVHQLGRESVLGPALLPKLFSPCKLPWKRFPPSLILCTSLLLQPETAYDLLHDMLLLPSQRHALRNHAQFDGISCLFITLQFSLVSITFTLVWHVMHVMPWLSFRVGRRCRRTTFPLHIGWMHDHYHPLSKHLPM